MQVLKDLPRGTLEPYLLEAIEKHVQREMQAYASSRQSDVTRGAETPELAALLVDKFGEGMAKTLHIVGISSDIQTTVDRLVREIDPDFDTHKATRWAARPAGLKLGAE